MREKEDMVSHESISKIILLFIWVCLVMGLLDLAKPITTQLPITYAHGTLENKVIKMKPSHQLTILL